MVPRKDAGFIGTRGRSVRLKDIKVSDNATLTPIFQSAYSGKKAV